jgi:hypothetical protein
MYIMQISRHSPESCPMFHEQARNMTVTLLQNLDEKLENHGMKMAGSWSDMPGHIIFNIFEAPSMDAYLEFLQEPEMMAWLSNHKVQNRVVLGIEGVREKFGLG